MISGTDLYWDPELDWGNPQNLSLASDMELPIHRDERGVLIVDAQEIAMNPYLQIYHSTTLPGCARDMDTWHVHKEQTDRFVALHGTAMFALSDGKKVERYIMDGATPMRLTIPPGVYHCFRVMGAEPFQLMNFPNRLYNPDDEGRIPFNMLEVAHPW